MKNNELYDKLTNLRPFQKIYVKHFKHNPEKHPTEYLYEVLDIGKNTETDEIMVIYKSLKNPSYIKNEIWVRPIDIFCSMIDQGKYPDEYEKYKYRFNIVSFDYIWSQRNKMTISYNE
jgi:hypothetical protein